MSKRLQTAALAGPALPSGSSSPASARLRRGQPNLSQSILISSTLACATDEAGVVFPPALPWLSHSGCPAARNSAVRPHCPTRTLVFALWWLAVVTLVAALPLSFYLLTILVPGPSPHYSLSVQPRRAECARVSRKLC